MLDDMVFVGTVHGHLTALDRTSGAVRWDIAVEDNKKGYYLTLAPLALDGKIVVGVSGAETGIRGFIDAYDPKTGRRLWRTFAVPAQGERGSETWGKDSWKTGGGSTWLTGSYDPELNLLYWATGNPAPDWNADERPETTVHVFSPRARSSGRKRSGTSSSRLTISTIGIPTRRSSCSMRRSTAARANSWRRPTGTGSITCSIARRVSFWRERHTSADVG